MKNWLPRCARMGHKVNGTSIKRLLPKLGFSRQSNRKADERSYHPDRNGQFEHINIKVPAAPAAGQPVISVDTKKKELVGNFKNAGSTTPALDGCGLRDHWLARPAGQASISGSCPLGRGFAPRFLQTSPRDDALALR